MMLESLSDSSDRMIVRDSLQTRVPPASKRGRRLIFFCPTLVPQRREVNRLHGVLSPPDKLVIGDIIINSDVIHASPHLGAALWGLLVKAKPMDYRRMGLVTHLLKFAIKKARVSGN